MIQGNFASKFQKAIDTYDSLVKSGQISNQAKINSLQSSINSAAEYALNKKESYRLDLKNETIGQWSRRVFNEKEEEDKVRTNFKRDQKILSKQINDYKKKELKAQKSNNTSQEKLIKERRTQLETTKKMREAEKEAFEATSKMSGKASANPYIAAILVVGGAILSAAKSILGTAVGLLKKLIPKNFDFLAPYKWFLKFQTLSGKISVNAGLIASESANFLDNLPMMMQDVLDVGGTLEDINTVFTKFSQVTNKNRLFTSKEYKGILNLGLGTSLGAEGAADFVGNFENMGYSIDKTLEFTEYVRGKAMGINLNQSNILNKINKLTLSLTGFGISMGLKGMTRLITKAEKLRFDVVNSTQAFQDAFINPEAAIEAAAKIKLLGGKFAYYFSDAFTLMGKSMLEPEQLTADLIEALKDKAFKGKNGFEISPADREMIRELSNALGQDPDNLITLAIEQGKDSDKIKELRKRGIFETNMDEDKAELLKNLMTLNEDGSYSIRLSNGVTQRLSEIPSNVTIFKTLEQERKNNESALLRKSLSERIGIAIDRFMIGFSQVFVELNKYFRDFDTITNLDNTVKSITDGMGKFLTDKFDGEWGDILKKGLQTANLMIDNLLLVWNDPNKGLPTMLSNSVDIIGQNLMKYMMKPLEFYSGKLVYMLGKAVKSKLGFGGQSLMRAGLKIQSDGLMGASDSFTKNNMTGLNKSIDSYNEKYSTVDPNSKIAKIGFTATGKIIRKKLLKPLMKAGLKSIGKVVTKQILKKIPVLGLFMGIIDAVSYAIEGNYGQAGIALAGGVASTLPGLGTAASIALDGINLGIDYNKDYSVDNFEKADDLIMRADGTIKKGQKGSAKYFLDEIRGNNLPDNTKPGTINLVLSGKIINKYKKGFYDKNTYNTTITSSKMVLKQMIDNLA